MIRRNSKRRREFLVLVAVFAVPGLVLLPVIHLRTGFTASLRARSLQFRTSERQGNNVGLFNSELPLELTIERFDRIESQDGPAPVSIANPGGQESVTFAGAQLRSVDMRQPLQVSIAFEDGKLSMAIERPGSDRSAVATVVTGGESRLSCNECIAAGPDGKAISGEKLFEVKPRNWSVYAREHSRLHLQLRPVKGRIAAEHEIRLAKDSAVTFEVVGRTAAAGADGEVQIAGLAREPLKLKGHSLVLGKLRGDPEEDDARIVNLEPEGAGVKVDLGGSSDSILLNGSNKAATLAEYLTSQKPLATYLGTVVLIGSTILTILTRLKLLKLKD